MARIVILMLPVMYAGVAVAGAAECEQEEECSAATCSSCSGSQETYFRPCDHDVLPSSDLWPANLTDIRVEFKDECASHLFITVAAPTGYSAQYLTGAQVQLHVWNLNQYYCLRKHLDNCSLTGLENPPRHFHFCIDLTRESVAAKPVLITAKSLPLPTSATSGVSASVTPFTSCKPKAVTPALPVATTVVTSSPPFSSTVYNPVDERIELSVMVFNGTNDTHPSVRVLFTARHNGRYRLVLWKYVHGSTPESVSVNQPTRRGNAHYTFHMNQTDVCDLQVKVTIQLVSTTDSDATCACDTFWCDQHCPRTESRRYHIISGHRTCPTRAPPVTPSKESSSEEDEVDTYVIVLAAILAAVIFTAVAIVIKFKATLCSMKKHSVSLDDIEVVKQDALSVEPAVDSVSEYIDGMSEYNVDKASRALRPPASAPSHEASRALRPPANAPSHKASRALRPPASAPSHEHIAVDHGKLAKSIDSIEQPISLSDSSNTRSRDSMPSSEFISSDDASYVPEGYVPNIPQGHAHSDCE